MRKPDGTFQKGISGNPGGTPKSFQEVVALARTKSTRCIEMLFDLAENSTNDGVRVNAIEAILDRGWGKPKQALELSGDPERPIAIREWTDAALMARLAEIEGQSK
jgi:hypothetical protein